MPNSNTFERVVFITRLSAIGDVLIASRAVHTLAQNGYFPVFVTSLQTKDIALNIRGIAACICSDVKGKNTYFWQKNSVDATAFLHKLQSVSVRSAPIILDLQRTGRSRRATRFLQKELNIRFTRKFKVAKRTLFRLWLILLARLTIRQRSRYKLGSMVRITELQLAAIKKIIATDKKEFVPLSQEEKIIEMLPLPSYQEKYICIFPGASGFLKAWPKEQLRKLVSALLLQTDFKVFICGSSQEEEIGDYLAYPFHTKVTNLVNKMPLGETLRLIAHAEYVVTNDSFAAHAADVFFIPATVIFGATSPRFGFVPVYDKIRVEYANLACSPCTRHGQGSCRYKNLKCLTAISYESVLKNIHDTSRRAE